MGEKKYCQTHHLYYYGIECPLCFNERMLRYKKKFESLSEKKKEKIESLEVTQDSLEKLKEKFNRK